MASANNVIIVLLSILTFGMSNECADEEDIQKLISSRSPSDTIPSESEAVEVAVGLRLQKMNLVADSNLLHIDAFLQRAWTDRRLNFDDSNPCSPAVNGAHVKHWVPQLSSVNGESLHVHQDNTLTIIQSNGTIVYNQRIEIAAPCLTDALSYPFGNTSCTLIWRNEHFSRDRLRLHWDSTVASRPFATEASIDYVGDMRVMHISFVQNSSLIPSGNFDELIVEIHFSRLSNKTVLLFYFPSTLFIVVSWLSLVLGPMAITRAVMNVGAFVLLLLHYSSNMADLPRTTGITAIDVWKVVTMVFVLATIFELVLVTCMASVGRSRRLTRCCHRLPSKKGRYTMEPLYEELNDLRQRKTRVTCSCCRYAALVVDFISLNLFAAAFIAFAFFYFTKCSAIVSYLNGFQLSDLSIP